MVDKLALGQVSVPVLLFLLASTIPPLLHTHSAIYTLLLPEGQTGEVWGRSKMDRKELSLLSSSFNG